MSEIFFSSDWHFMHRRINDLSDRPFASMEEHDETLIENWNSRVKPEDYAFFLGDAALGPWPEGLMKVKRLNGKIIIIPGNHDRISSVEKESRREKYRAVYEEVFHEIGHEMEMILIGEQGPPVIMSHYPPAQIKDHGDVDRYPHLRPDDSGLTILHGHTHQTRKVTRLDSGALAIHVGVDSWDYRPVSMDEILELVDMAGGTE